LGGFAIVRKVLSGTTLLDDGDGKESVGTLPDPATFLSEEALDAYAESHAEEVGLVVQEVNYVPFLGGTAEFVLRPNDEIKFMRNLDENMYSFFRGYPAQDVDLYKSKLRGIDNPAETVRVHRDAWCEGSSPP